MSVTSCETFHAKYSFFQWNNDLFMDRKMSLSIAYYMAVRKVINNDEVIL